MRDIQKETADKYQEFFNFMSQEYDLILTIEQMDEIVFEAQRLVKKLPIHNVSGSALKTCPNCKTKNYHYYAKTNSWCCAYC